jgi:hypothetical protein
MKDTIILILIFLFIAALGVLVGYKVITKGGGENSTLPGGDLRSFISIDRGKITFISTSPTSPTTLSASQTNFIVMRNVSAEKHDVVIARIIQSTPKVVEEVLRTTSLDPLQEENVRIRLTAGEYVIYCSVKRGELEHRKYGEEMKVTVR